MDQYLETIFKWLQVFQYLGVAFWLLFPKAGISNYANIFWTSFYLSTDRCKLHLRNFGNFCKSQLQA